MGILDSKPNINPRVKLTFEDDSGYANQNNETIPESFITKSVEDNFYINRPIPASDHQYYWMSSSIVEDNRVMFPAGYATSSADMTFVTSSEYAFGTWTTNSWLNLNVNSSSFTTLAPIIDTSARSVSINVSSTVDPIIARSYFSRMGPYNFSSWQAIRIGEHPVARYMKENNELFIHDAPRYRHFVDGGKVYVAGEKRNINGVEYEEPPVTVKYQPLIHRVSTQVENQIGYFSATGMKYTHANHIGYFANKEINDKLDVDEDVYLPYDSFKGFYTGKEPELETVGEFLSLKYTETVWPQEANAFLGKVKNRVNFVFNWRNDRTNRIENSASNSQGHNIPTASMWPLDARKGPYETAALFTTASISSGGNVGELMSVNSVFHNGAVARLTSSALFTMPTFDSSSAGVFFTNDTVSRFCIDDGDYVFTFGYVFGGSISATVISGAIS